MQKNIEISGAKILLDAPNTRIDTALVFIPGVSGNARGDRFAPLVDVAVEKGYAIARVDMWDTSKDLESHTLQAIMGTLDAVLKALTHEGFSHFVMVGKSFGGGIALLYNNPSIVQKIGWAPAFGIADIGNIDEVFPEQLSKFPSTRDIHIGKERLSSITVPVGIVHGTADDAIPLQNSKDIIASVPRGTLIEIEGADHSFKKPEHEKELMEATKRLLQ